MTGTALDAWRPPEGAMTAEAVEAVVLHGDLDSLTAEDRVRYYFQACHALGLTPETRPLQFLQFRGRDDQQAKTILYATRDCTDQLRRRDKVSTRIRSATVTDGVLVVTAEASTPDGRTEESTGAVNLQDKKGVARANAYMTAETKAKRRATLSICGLGWLDESELDGLPDARPVEPTEVAPEASRVHVVRHRGDGSTVPVHLQPTAATPAEVANIVAALEEAEADPAGLEAVRRQWVEWKGPRPEPGVISSIEALALQTLLRQEIDAIPLEVHDTAPEAAETHGDPRFDPADMADADDLGRPFTDEAS
jgi:hypothetical protein